MPCKSILTSLFFSYFVVTAALNNFFSHQSTHTTPHNDNSFLFFSFFKISKISIHSLFWNTFKRHFNLAGSSLRCFYTSIGVNLCQIQLNGHDLVRHAPVNKRSNIWKWISEQKPSHEVIGKGCRVQWKDCVKTQIRGRLQKNTAALKVYGSM